MRYRRCGCGRGDAGGPPAAAGGMSCSHGVSVSGVGRLFPRASDWPGRGWDHGMVSATAEHIHDNIPCMLTCHMLWRRLTSPNLG